ncbi:MAG: hypothetical protein HETSPECPRED_003178 [Heterodermia speciosa]|uniref:Ribosomal protein S12 n=1 Tax=Heterodermia speciosa TaxID=116794 RepID=A0A8H3F534_9LECA|nr:MAG: hypothetical protein HETSPECPRED_003178 [Heterodermia speciosa]
MASLFSCSMSRAFTRPTTLSLIHRVSPLSNVPTHTTPFSTSTSHSATLMQVLRKARKPQRSRHTTSPALKNRPQMKAVCLKVTTVKPKKPNSGERRIARVRLSSGKNVQAAIPGEGHNVQQHSVVLVRGGRSQDCPGVRYHLVRGALDLVSSSTLDVREAFAKDPRAGWCREPYNFEIEVRDQEAEDTVSMVTAIENL